MFRPRAKISIRSRVSTWSCLELGFIFNVRIRVKFKFRFTVRCN